MKETSTKNLILAGLFAALTAVGAFIKIPLPYVPLTMQTAFTGLAGVVLPPHYAALSQLTYLILGLAGLPVFANGGGIGYVAQPTFGYLLAMPLAAFAIARMRKRIRTPSFLSIFLIVLFGLLFILAFGSLWLYAALNIFLATSIGLGKALWIGGLLFLPGSLVKAFAVALVARALGRTTR